MKSQEDVIATMKQIEPLLRGMIEYISEIEGTEDPELVDLYLDCLQEIEDAMAEEWGRDHRTVRQQIREGLGDFASISAKCVRLGLV